MGSQTQQLGAGELFDEGTLETLSSIGGLSFAGELITLFVRDTRVRVEAARAAFKAGDLAAVSRAVHALRGGAGQLGASVFATIAESAEFGAARRDLEAVGRAIGQLESMHEPLVVSLVSWLETAQHAATEAGEP